LRGGWSVRLLDRQIATQFFERTQSSRNKAAILRRGHGPEPSNSLTTDQEIKDPLVLEFLGLKDEYSENALEEALILRLEHFLLELGSDFAFIARQRRLRVGDEWYRIDLLFFHRRLRCLVIVDLKIGRPAEQSQIQRQENPMQQTERKPLLNRHSIPPRWRDLPDGIAFAPER
jgi:predicted nuclease of restriction endonuclease-like (RecB) superfamily